MTTVANSTSCPRLPPTRAVVSQQWLVVIPQTTIPATCPSASPRSHRTARALNQCFSPSSFGIPLHEIEAPYQQSYRVLAFVMVSTT